MNEEFEKEFAKLSEKDKREVNNLIRFMQEKKYHDKQYEELLNQYIELSRDYEYLQFKIDKANELIKRKLSTETYQHLKVLYDDIDSTEEIWEDYEFEELLDILKEENNG